MRQRRASQWRSPFRALRGADSAGDAEGPVRFHLAAADQGRQRGVCPAELRTEGPKSPSARPLSPLTREPTSRRGVQGSPYRALDDGQDTSDEDVRKPPGARSGRRGRGPRDRRETVSARRGPRRLGAWARVAGSVAGGTAATTAVVFLVVLGYGFARTGLGGLNDPSQGAARERSVDGVVLAKDRVSEPQGSSSMRIEVQFTTDAGTSYRFWEAGDADIGDTIPVHYEPGRPETASTHPVTSNRIMYGILAVAGFALVILMPLLALRLGRESLRHIGRAARKRSAVG
ncbi:DUF3592 domain-containing protein [Streptomyces sp. NPDC058595]|uniref:DUF3592 domain-containing protein n=1 Tax=Streptomyces sp. NPDC058595 TaxID=3346550 RepID=UPI0036605EAC